MKKLLALVLAAILVLSFVGCSKTENGELAVGIELTSEEYGIGFRKGSDLTAEVNKIMAELTEDGTMKKLADKYGLVLATSAPAEEEKVTLKELDAIKEKGELVIGITDYKPMNYKDDKGKWTGFDTEFAQKVCEKLGIKAKFVEIEWDNKFVQLESKAIDCIWNGMTITDEVLKNTSCSKAYLRNAQVVVMSEEDVREYKDAKSMKDLKFAVEAGSAGAKAAKENGFKDVVEAAAQTDAFLEVESGACDACIIDLTMANAMINKKK